jgi:hypothetical protein
VFGRVKEDPERRSAVETMLQQPHQQQQPLKMEQYTPSAPFPTPLPTAHYLPHSPSINTHAGDIFISRPSASASPALSSYAPPSASTSTYNLPPIDPTRADCGFAESSTLPKPETVNGEDSLREEEVAASLSLEYMALGRRRASTQLPVRSSLLLFSCPLFPVLSPFPPFRRLTLSPSRPRQTSSILHLSLLHSSSKPPRILLIQAPSSPPPPPSPQLFLLRQRSSPSSSTPMPTQGGITPPFMRQPFERRRWSFWRIGKKRGWRRLTRRGWRCCSLNCAAVSSI